MNHSRSPKHLFRDLRAIALLFGVTTVVFMIALKSRVPAASSLSSSESITRPCERGGSTWYQIEDGPLATAFDATGMPDKEATIDTMVCSSSLTLAEKDRDEAQGAPRTASLRESVCSR